MFSRPTDAPRLPHVPRAMPLSPAGSCLGPQASAGRWICKGMSVDEMQKRFAWKHNDSADAHRLQAKKNGVAVERGEDGRWHVVSLRR